jgi:CBS domain containing-hemolysin-like protein
VVGEIDDEHDETTRARVIEAAPGVFEADARAALEDLEAAIGEDLGAAEIEEAVDTVGGLVSALAGRVAQRGEVIAHPAGFEFQIVDADPRRVRRVRVHRAAGPDNTPAENLT